MDGQFNNNLSIKLVYHLNPVSGTVDFTDDRDVSTLKACQVIVD